jgi:hypothetical protein
VEAGLAPALVLEGRDKVCDMHAVCVCVRAPRVHRTCLRSSGDVVYPDWRCLLGRVLAPAPQDFRRTCSVHSVRGRRHKFSKPSSLVAYTVTLLGLLRIPDAWGPCRGHSRAAARWGPGRAMQGAQPEGPRERGPRRRDMHRYLNNQSHFYDMYQHHTYIGTYAFRTD